MRFPIECAGVLRSLDADYSANDREFFERVYRGGLGTYVERLEQIGMCGCRRVLDAGCGFGQWTLSLERVNASAVGVDVARPRVKAGRRVAERNGVDGVEFLQSGLEQLPFAPGTFDSVFSYSVVYFVDFERAAEEFYRVLEPGGELYVCTNGVGKYLHDIVHRPNPTTDFDPRRFALRTIGNTLLGRTDSLSLDAGARFMTPRGTERTLRQSGFRDVRVGGEGTLTADGRSPGANRFYEATYLGFSNVFELTARKPEV